MFKVTRVLLARPAAKISDGRQIGIGGRMDLLERRSPISSCSLKPREDAVSQALVRVRSFILGMLWSLKPPRLFGVPATLAIVVKHYLGLGAGRGELPNPEYALNQPDGLAGICTDMSVATLRQAYAMGLFPFAHIGPQKWWAPKERMSLFIEDFHIERNLRRRLRQRDFHVTFDQDFDAVIRACAEPRQGRVPLTWIRDDIIEAYTRAHQAGLAHSVEVWDAEGKLVGGAYGLAIGRVFFTESQFSRKRDASKVGFATLNCHLQRWGFVLNDGKHLTGHLSQLGFVLIPRRSLNALLLHACKASGREGRWEVDRRIDIANWNPKLAARAA
jgi:leucyl/phenylalanyl-tRNA--protein transferase